MPSTHLREENGLKRGQNFMQDLNKTIGSAVGWLRREQTEQGYWAGFLKTNSTIESEWVIAMYFMGITDDPKYDSVVQTIRNEQRADGSWEVYFEAPAGDISTTVESYVALRIAGDSPDAPHMQRAREWILAHGGLAKIRVFTRIWLALLGEWPWDATPNLPPELVFLPSWFPINLYKFASWGRATIVALILVTANRPHRDLPPDKRLDELFPQGRDKLDYSMPRPKSDSPLAWFFYYADKLLNSYTHLPFHPGRDAAIKACIEWIVRRQEADGCWAGIQPPWINAVVGLYAQGYALDHPVVKNGLQAFNEPWAFHNEKGTYLQCCTSPVWDTVLTMQALSDCGLDGQDESMARAIDYVLGQQITAPGDWQVYCPNVPSGGWAFEYENDSYPDVDDSAVALLSLAHMASTSAKSEEIHQAIDLGMRWIAGLRCSNGAWAAFDKDNDSPIVAEIPFSDFGEALDPPSADVTSHVIEVMGFLGQNMHNSEVVRRAVQYLRNEQEEAGCWFGRWGVNYVYGTGLVLPGLQAAGEDMDAPYVRKACDWLQSKQNDDGGWGETCASYMDPSLAGTGPSTPSQTGWALMGLLATSNHAYDKAIYRGVEYLVRTHKDGTWEQMQYTGTGFPGYGRGARTEISQATTLTQGKELGRGFMLNYAMYRHYFPLMALGRARKHFAALNESHIL